MSARDGMLEHAAAAEPAGKTTAVRLAEIVSALEEVEARATQLRAERNHLLYLAMTKEGCTERAAATMGKVSPTYAHRIRAYAGEPPSGPTMDDVHRHRGS